jgi:DNA replication protein DnaC
MKQIETQFSQLRLNGMTKSWQALLETRRHMELSLVEGLELLLHSEIQDREQRRFDRLQKNAKFRYQASIEELQFDASRGLDKDLITVLATGDYIKKGQPILITGATGCGKSFLASALGHHACAQGYKVAYYNLHKLMQRTKIARLEGSIHKFFDKTAKMDLLILDDFGISNMDQQQQLDFMEIMEDRHAKRSTIIVSQLPVSSWFHVFGEETIADAILDRLVHTSFRFELKGDSLRKMK